jgi:Na+-driven multidrug efflux pump
MLISLAGYWGLGLMSAAVFGVYLDFGGQAIWISLAAAVSVVGVLLVRRFLIQSLRLTDAARHST